MNSRERILCTLEHRRPDRCATFKWMDSRVEARAKDYMGLEPEAELEDVLPIDRWRGASVPIDKPVDRLERMLELVPPQVRRMPGVDVRDSGYVVKDGFHVWHPLQDAETVEEVEAYPFERPEWVRPVTDELKAHFESLKGDAVVLAATNQPFKTAWELRGMENLLCDFLLNPDLIELLYDRIYAFATAYCRAAAEAGADVIQIYGDLAMHDRLLMPPALWRRFDKPRLAALFDAVREVNPDVQTFMHTDGDVSAIVPDLVEVGLDMLNPIQPECLDPFEFKDRWGDRLVLHGCVSLQRTLPFGSVEDVREEVRGLVAHCGRDGGFVLGPTNGITPDVPAANVVAMYDAVV